MSLFKFSQYTWGNSFDHTWRDFTRDLLPGGKWKMRTKELADHFREVGWAQNMTPQEARFRGMIVLLEEYVGSSDGRYADLAHFADVLAFSAPRGVQLPDKWRQIREGAVVRKESAMPDNIKEGVFGIFWGAAGFVGCGIFVVGLIGAVLIAVGRALVYLKTDHWISSACETASALERDTSAWCNVNTDWKGFDRLYNWATGTFDVSFLLFVVGLTIFLAIFAMMIVLMKIVFPSTT